MKRRTRNKVIKQFCINWGVKIEWFKDWAEGRTAKQIKASLIRRMDDLMDSYQGY